jgi:uncharacterized protein YoaH (UPF0181 family)
MWQLRGSYVMSYVEVMWQLCGRYVDQLCATGGSTGDLVALVVEDLRRVLVKRGKPSSDAEKIAKELDCDVEKIKHVDDIVSSKKIQATLAAPPVASVRFL